MIFADKVYYVEHADTKVQEYITEHFQLLLPFIVKKGLHEQIRIHHDQYNVISDDIKMTLRVHAEYPHESDFLNTGEQRSKWFHKNYWTPCNAYIFNFILSDSYTLQARCVWGYEGVEESYRIAFIGIEQFPMVIWKNLGCSEKRRNFKEY